MGQCASSDAGTRVDPKASKYLVPKADTSGLVGEKAFSDDSAASTQSCGSKAETVQAAESDATDVIDITPCGAPESDMIAHMLNPESEAAMGLPYQVSNVVPGSTAAKHHKIISNLRWSSGPSPKSQSQSTHIAKVEH